MRVARASPATAMRHLHPPAHDRASDLDRRVRVERRGSCLSTVAAVDLAEGAGILFVDGDVVDRPDRYSVQIGPALHVGAGDVGERDGSSGRRPWRFLNHSCRPNATLRGRLLVALRPIAADEHVTFDYEANEYEMAEPFLCSCGEPTCRGWIRGYRHLSPAQRRSLAPLVAPWLRDSGAVAD